MITLTVMVDRCSDLHLPIILVVEDVFFLRVQIGNWNQTMTLFAVSYAIVQGEYSM
jgi:hypothetical protein